MDEFTCPKCESEDVRGAPQGGGEILLTCQACQATWPRTPKASCPKCGRGDVEEYGREAWSYVSPTEPGGDPEASWTYVPRRTLRCRKCGTTWGSSLSR